MELRAAGCETMVQEHGSGASRARPALARLVREIAAGDTLVVVRLDRLARSVSHLLEVIEDLTARTAHFRSLRDPIGTTTPQGMFSLQVLGAVAQLERALISERTKAGIKAAKAKGSREIPARSDAALSGSQPRAQTPVACTTRRRLPGAGPGETLGWQPRSRAAHSGASVRRQGF